MFDFLKKNKRVVSSIFLFLVVFNFWTGIMAATPSKAEAFLPAIPLIWSGVAGVVGLLGIAKSIWWPNMSFADATIGTIVRIVTGVIYSLAEFILVFIAAPILNTLIPLTLDTAYYNLGGVIFDAWKIIRDIFNMALIFILLYISISTILQLKSVNTGQMLTSLIIIAMLINFSLPITRVVIDGSNIIAAQFWNALTENGEVSPVDKLTDALNITELKMIGDDEEEDEKEEVALTNFQITLINIGGAGVQLATAFVFMIGGGLMMLRTITLIILMVISPAAFVAFLVPKYAKYFAQWSDTLVAQAVYAPIFLFFLWLTIKVIQSDTFQNIAAGGSWNNFFTNEKAEPGSAAVIFVFMFVIGLLSASILAAKELGLNVGAVTSSIGLAGGAALGTGGAFMRQTAGRFAQSRVTAAVAAGKTPSRIASAFATSSFDARKIPIASEAIKGATGISLGQAGGAGGFAKLGKIGGGFADRQKAAIEAAKAPGKEAREQAKEAREAQAKTEADRIKALASNPATNVRDMQTAVQGATPEILKNLDLATLQNANVAQHLQGPELASVLRRDDMTAGARTAIVAAIRRVSGANKSGNDYLNNAASKGLI